MYIYIFFFLVLLRDTWEKKHIFVQRNNPDYYKGLFSTAEFDRILREVRKQLGFWFKENGFDGVLVSFHKETIMCLI